MLALVVWVRLLGLNVSTKLSINVLAKQQKSEI
jgi:hypothetical protein